MKYPLAGPFSLAAKFERIAKAASPNSKDVHPGGVYFFGRPPTTGNRRMLGLRTAFEPDALELYVTRLDVWQERIVQGSTIDAEFVKNVRSTVVCQTMEFRELRDFLRSNIFYVGPAGWEVRVVSKKSRTSAVEILGEYGAPYQV